MKNTIISFLIHITILWQQPMYAENRGMEGKRKFLSSDLSSSSVSQKQNQYNVQVSRSEIKAVELLVCSISLCR